MADFNHLSGQASGQLIEVSNTTFVLVHTAGASKEDVRVIATNEGTTSDDLIFKIDTAGDAGTARVKTVQCPAKTPFVIFDGVLAPTQKIYMKSVANLFAIEGKIKTF